MSEEEIKNDDSMEDILASIRETVEDEVGKTEAPSASSVENDLMAENTDADDVNEIEDIVDIDDIMAGMEEEAPAEPEIVTDNADTLAAEALTTMETDEEAVEPVDEEKPADEALTKDISNDDILDLTEVVDDVAAEDLVDVDKFASNGEVAPANAESVKEARDNYEESDDIDVDSLMNELEESGDLPDENEELPSEEDATNMMVDSEENITEESTAAAEVENDESINVEEAPETKIEPKMTEPEVTETEAEAETERTEATAPIKAVDHAVNEIAQKVFLPTTPSAKGLQVSFPSEVLAEALRPLVTGWIEENLADIVERLVKEELSKLVEK